MSTTFEVYPKINDKPSFTELINLSERKLGEFLSEFNLNDKPKICICIYSVESNIEREINLSSPVIWNKDEYAWFYIENIVGGTDAYFCKFDELDKECWNDEFTDNNKIIEREEFIKECIKNEYYWYFRRSAGQPAIISLTYGLIASALAELTEGFIISNDSGWDYSKFPAISTEFDKFYFRPDKALDPEYKEWSEHCIKIIIEDLSSLKQ